MNQYFLATGTQNQERTVYLATNLLRGDTATWWRHHYERHIGDKATVPIWNEFEKLITKKFKPVNATKIARDQLANLRQTGSVKTYNSRFTSIILEIPTIDEEEQLDRYTRGLKEKVHIEVELREPHDLEDAMRIADRFDTIMTTYTTLTNPTKWKPLDPTTMKTDANQNIPRLKKLTEEEREKLRRTGACFACRQPGHLASQCPKRITQTLRNIQEKEVRMRIKKTTTDTMIPQTQTPGAIGLDLHANKKITIPTKQREVVPTGIAVEVPKGHYLRIAPRSGLSKKGIDIGASVVDPDYRGEIKALLINNSADDVTIQKHDRIAQAILEKATVSTIEEVPELGKTERGEKGFGSTNNV